MSTQRKQLDPTLAYYSQNAHRWAASTNASDRSRFYGPFDSVLPTNATILDLGSGSGPDARRFAATGHNVLALDPCPEMLEQARLATPPDIACRIHYILAGAPDLPLADSCCSGVWASASLLHLHRPSTHLALRECHRVLIPRGIMWILVKAGTGEDMWGGVWHTYWTMNSLADAVQAAQFEIISTNEPAELYHPNTIWLSVLARKR